MLRIGANQPTDIRSQRTYSWTPGKASETASKPAPSIPFYTAAVFEGGEKLQNWPGYCFDGRSAGRSGFPDGRCGTFALLLTLSVAPAASADDWINPAAGDWFAPGNWSDGTVPTGSDIVRIDNGGIGQIQAPGAQSTTTHVGAGLFNTGTLAISGGGTLNNTGTIIGFAPSSSGTVSVEGSGSRLTTTGSAIEALIHVGVTGGIGELIIGGGGTVTNDGHSHIGFGSGAIGTATVTGADSSWTSDRDLILGRDGGTGTLIITTGAEVRNSDGYVGSAGGEGSVIVSGPNSVWWNEGADGFGGGLLLGGIDARGTLDISNGGAVYSAYGIVQSEGIVTVTGADARWSVAPFLFGASGNLTIGQFGAGTLTIADGGTVNTGANGTVSLGVNAGSSGILNIGAGSGAAAVASGTLYAASVAFGAGTGQIVLNHTDDDHLFSPDISGNGSIRVESGTTTLTGANTYIGETRIVSGRINASGGAAIGDLSDVTLSAAGTLGIIDSEKIGYLAGGGTVRLGAGATLTIGRDGAPNTTFAGYFVEDAAGGAIVKAGTGALWLTRDHSYSGGTNVRGGELVINGGSIAHPGANMVVGEQSADVAALTIMGGGAVSNATGIVGDAIGSTGTVTVKGAGSTWTGDLLRVGSSGGGTLTIADGGLVEIGGGLTLADLAGSSGTLNIGAGAVPLAPMLPGVLDAPTLAFGAGSGTINFNHTAAGYSFSTDLSGSGTINHFAGTTILTGDGDSFSGTATVNGGTLLVNGALGGDVAVLDGAAFGGTGLAGTVTVADGATLAPGASAGTLSVASLILNGNSILAYELGAVGGVNDLIEVTGDLTLDGVLNIADLGGFGPGVYRLMNYGGGLVNNGLGLGTLPGGVAAGDLAVQTSIVKQVNLLNGAGVILNFWDGTGVPNDGLITGGDGVWNLVNGNWTDATGTFNGSEGGGFAIFQGAPGTVSVDAGGGAITTTGMQFAVDGYSVTGDAVVLTDPQSPIRVGDGTVAGAGYSATIASGLTGPGGLAKTDLGTLVLTGANSYQGGSYLLGGVLQVSQDINLGAANSGLTFNGGTLATTANFDSARAVTLAGSGAIDVAAGTTLGLVGDIAGAGNLVKRGAGILKLTGQNGYGNTLVETGTLVGDAGSISGSISTAGTVVFEQAGDAVFSGDIAGHGGTNGAMIKDGAGTLSLTGNSLLDWTIDAGGLVSTAERFGGHATVRAGAALTFDQTGDASYAGKLSGDGAFAKIGTGTLTLTGDSSGFAGTATVSAGGLTVNGSLGGLIELNGGWLGGSGIVGDIAVGSGGVVTPGNSIGTLSAGSITFKAGSAYEFEIDAAGNSDLIAATGTAIIESGATANVIRFPNYALDTSYTILTAAGGVTGSFDTAHFAGGSVFITPTLTYDTNAVYFTLSKKAFDSVALTPNQKAAAGGADSLGSSHAVSDAIVVLTNAGSARAAFDSLSGDVYASANTTLIEDGRFAREAAIHRLRNAFEAVGASKAGMAERQLSDTLTSWGRGFGSWGHWNSDGNAAKMDRTIGGFVVGGDALVANNVRLGLMGGYSLSSFNVDGRSSSGSADTYTVGAYGGGQWGDFALRGGAAFSWHSLNVSRNVAFAGFSDGLSASYDARTLQAHGEAAYGMTAGELRFEPFANLAYVNLSADGFAESGGSSALIASGNVSDATFATLGLRAEANLKLSEVAAKIRGILGYRRAFGNTPTSALSFASGGDAFTVAGVPIARNALVLEAGFDVNLTPSATLGLSYGGQFGSGLADQSLKASLNARF